MPEHPYMPVLVQSILADTTWMTAEQMGVYCRLLYTMWANGGRLHNDERELARIGGVTLKRWRNISPRILDLLIEAGKEISQGKLTKTWLEVQERRVKHVRAALRGHGRLSNSNGLGSVHAEQGTYNENQNKNLLSLERGTPIGPEELSRLRQSHLPLSSKPVEVKQRGRR